MMAGVYNIKVSFVLPTRNEQNNILQTIDEIQKACSKINNFIYEIIFVNDFSTDDSVKIINKELKKNILFVK
jgi:glycosyltransferase involved in cell wall biosynthesis